MPRLSQELSITTSTSVELSPKLQNTIRKVLAEYRELKGKAAGIEKELSSHKDELESLFLDADQYAALEEGVRVTTPFGDVPLKIVKGETAPKLNEKKLMKKFKLTPEDLDSCRDAGKPKKAYLGIYLPKDRDSEDDE